MECESLEFMKECHWLLLISIMEEFVDCFYTQLYFKGWAGLKGHISSSEQEDDGEWQATATTQCIGLENLHDCQLSDSVGFMLIL